MDDQKAKLSKADWGPGPWQDEPDRVDFMTEAGFPGLVLRNEQDGNLCGYVAVPPGHLLHGVSYMEIESSVEVHGGLTYSGKCRGKICHVPAPGEPDDVFWFGFDCAHCFDRRPGSEALLRTLGSFASADLAARAARDEVYRTVEYVKAECEKLAKQLAKPETIERDPELLAGAMAVLEALPKLS